MNYINQLQGERDGLQRQADTIADGLNDLRRYLQSDKFRCGDRLDGYVNTADVLAYLRNAEMAGIVARESGVVS